MQILLTGGAGYIGSHTALALSSLGHDVTVYDNLSTGHRWAVSAESLVVGDLRDKRALESLFRNCRFDAVVHFAAASVVAESVLDPLKYYEINTRGMLALLEACGRHGVNKFVFSSTAAVYGHPKTVPIREEADLAPINPYGASKLMCERMLSDAATVMPLRFVSLRYFNAAGADPKGRLGEAHEPETHLIPLVAQVAAGRRRVITINGADYPTPDGTCIRDYVHVVDLAQAHADALGYLARGGPSTALNCGYGRGASVRQVVDAAACIAGRSIPIEMGPRRPGDPAILVANADRIRATLGWRPRFDRLETMVEHALTWERARPRRLQESANAGDTEKRGLPLAEPDWGMHAPARRTGS